MEDHEAQGLVDAAKAVDVDALWRQTASLLESKPALAAAIKGARLVSVERGGATIEVADVAAVERLTRRSSMIESALSEAAGGPLRARFVAGGRAPEQEAERSGPFGPTEAHEARVMEHPLVRQAMEVFGARVASVERVAERAEPVEPPVEPVEQDNGQGALPEIDTDEEADVV